MNLFITGATGFIGSQTVPRLLEAGHTLRCFVQQSSDISQLTRFQVEVIPGSIAEPIELATALQDQDAVIHLAYDAHSTSPAHLREFNSDMNQMLISACMKAGVKRFVAISSTAASAAKPSEYGKLKQEMESFLSSSGLEFTVIRPGLVYGSGTRGLFPQMVKTLRDSPFIPIVGKGDYPIHIVYLDDLAAVIARCLEDPSTISKKYDLAEKMGFEEFLDLLLDVLNLKKRKLHFPVNVAYILASLGEKCLRKPPFRKDQIRNLLGEKHVDIGLSIKELDYSPGSFADIEMRVASCLNLSQVPSDTFHADRRMP